MPRVEASKSQIAIYTTGKQSAKQPTGQYVIDVAGLRDPQSSGGFRIKFSDGRPGEVQDYMREDDRVDAIIGQVELLCWLAFKCQFSRSNDGFLSFIIQDHHGRWIAPAVGEILTDYLAKLGYNVYLEHYVLEAK